MKTTDSLAHDVPLAAIMTTGVKQLSVDDPVERARALFLDHAISGAPVVGLDGRLCGVVSKTDLLRDAWLVADRDDIDLTRAEREQLGPGFHAEQSARATVGDIMTPFAVALPPEASVARAAALMACEGVHRIVVTDGDDRVVGLVSLVDIARWTAQRAGFLVPRGPVAAVRAA